MYHKRFNLKSYFLWHTLWFLTHIIELIKAENHLLSNLFFYYQFSRKYVNKKLINKTLSFFHSLSRLLILCFPVPVSLNTCHIQSAKISKLLLEKKVLFKKRSCNIYKSQLTRCNVIKYFLGLRMYALGIGPLKTSEDNKTNRISYKSKRTSILI